MSDARGVPSNIDKLGGGVPRWLGASSRLGAGEGDCKVSRRGSREGSREDSIFGSNEEIVTSSEDWGSENKAVARAELVAVSRSVVCICWASGVK